MEVVLKILEKVLTHLVQSLNLVVLEHLTKQVLLVYSVPQELIRRLEAFVGRKQRQTDVFSRMLRFVDDKLCVAKPRFELRLYVSNITLVDNRQQIVHAENVSYDFLCSKDFVLNYSHRQFNFSTVK